MSPSEVGRRAAHGNPKKFSPGHDEISLARIFYQWDSFNTENPLRINEMSESKPVVRVEKYNGISTIILNRPEKRNAMSPALHKMMEKTLLELEVDPETKVVVIRGSGGNFSAGQDLKEFFRELEDKPAESKQMQELANRWRWDLLYNYDKPTIAMIEGYCVGGAFMQLLATDFAIAADTAQFSLSEVNWGILPG